MLLNTICAAPIDVLLLEGWCLGFEAKAENPSGWIEPINQYLKQYNALYNKIDAMVVMQIPELQWVYRWREEAEAKMRAANKPAMSVEETKDFIDRFYPVYQCYLPGLYRKSKTTPIPCLTFCLDEHRAPLNFQYYRP